jgi:hypothetical protein
LLAPTGGTLELARRRGLAAALAAWVASTACVVPTDRGDGVRADFPVDLVTLVVGDTARVPAVGVTGDSVALDLPVAYASLDENIAVISADGVILGVGEGETRVLARVATYEKGIADSVTVLVSRGILIRSIQGEVSGPGNDAFFGETIELSGLRLAPESLSVVTIGAVPAAVVGYDPADAADPEGLERLRLRVPVVPPTSELLLVHRGGGTAARTLRIAQEDVFEIGGPLPVIDLSEGDYVNDALTASATDPDLLRIVLPAGPHTITATILDGRLLVEGEPELRFLAPQPIQYASLFEGYYIGSDIPDVWDWTVENRGLSCDLRTVVHYLTDFFNEVRGAGNVVTIALANTEPDTVDVLAATVGERIRYRLEARAGYHTDLPPDALEENDACTDATVFPPSPNSRDLSFDNITDFDWYDVTVGGGAAPTFAVTPQPEQEPNGVFAAAQLVTAGSRVTALRDTEGDIDVFAIDAAAGTLLDVDVRAYAAADRFRKYDCPDRCSQGTVPWAPPGSSMITDVVVRLRLYDETGALLTGDQVLPSPFLDGRLRYLVPASGRYYVEVEPFGGGRGNPLGAEQYYAVDFFAHESLADVQIDVESTDGLTDPQLVVVERRADKNAIVDVLNGPGPRESYARTMHAGQYLVLVYEASGLPGPYRLRVDEAAVPPVEGRSP